MIVERETDKGKQLRSLSFPSSFQSPFNCSFHFIIFSFLTISEERLDGLITGCLATVYAGILSFLPVVMTDRQKSSLPLLSSPFFQSGHFNITFSSLLSPHNRLFSLEKREKGRSTHRPSSQQHIYYLMIEKNKENRASTKERQVVWEVKEGREKNRDEERWNHHHLTLKRMEGASPSPSLSSPFYTYTKVNNRQEKSSPSPWGDEAGVQLTALIIIKGEKK